MPHAYLPFAFFPSRAVVSALGGELERAAVAAVRAVLQRQATLEIAHQQITWRGHTLAFSTRIGTRGDLIVDLDIGDPNLGERIIIEDDLRTAIKASRKANLKGTSR